MVVARRLAIALMSGILAFWTALVDIGPLGGQFIAIGTANGAGTGPGTNCDDDYDPRWSVYVDGRLPNGFYFCFEITGLHDVHGAGGQGAFKIEYMANCPLSGAAGWALTWLTSVRACHGGSGVPNNATAVKAFLETTGSSTVDRNIDVTHNDVQRRLPGGPWTNWGQDLLAIGPSPSYTIQVVDANSVHAFKAPLN